ncbi:hypothetical protein D3C73_831860 [compost metagenome]
MTEAIIDALEAIEVEDRHRGKLGDIGAHALQHTCAKRPAIEKAAQTVCFGQPLEIVLVTDVIGNIPDDGHHHRRTGSRRSQDGDAEVDFRAILTAADNSRASLPHISSLGISRLKPGHKSLVEAMNPFGQQDFQRLVQ